MTAYSDTQTLRHNLERRGINIPQEDANTLRRAELTLSAWGEEMCNGTIQRHEDEDGKPYRYWSSMWIAGAWSPRPRPEPTPDRERGALKRVAAVCERLGLSYYHQTDPRGCALYVSNEPLPTNDYTRGVPCAV
jgi:hypothetical protein